MRVVAPTPSGQPLYSASNPGSKLGARRHNLRTTARSLAENLERAGELRVQVLIELVLDFMAQRAGRVRRSGVTRGEDTSSAKEKADSVSGSPSIDEDTDAATEDDVYDYAEELGMESERAWDLEICDPVLVAERSSRRRVYDAMKVMCAIGVASRKTKKVIVWNGRAHLIPRSLMHQTDRRLETTLRKRILAPFPDEKNMSVDPSNPDLASGLRDKKDGLILENDHRVCPTPPSSSRQSEEHPSLRFLKSTSDPSPAALRAKVEQLRDDVRTRRIRRDALIGRLEALTSLRRCSTKQSLPRTGIIQAPFLIVRGSPERILRGENGETLMLSFKTPGRDTRLFSETDVACLLREHREKTRSRLEP